MKKINFKSVPSTLTQKEMKNVLGGSGIGCHLSRNGSYAGTVSCPIGPVEACTRDCNLALNPFGYDCICH